MKKIIHKLKKNRLVSKIAAVLTICMILISSFTVSSFAADEEEVTNSITDVWTGVTDSIMSLLGTAQGVFFGSSNSLTLDFGEPIPTLIGLELYPISNFPIADVGDSFDIVLSVPEVSLNATLTIYDSSFDSGLNGVTFSKIAVAEVGDEAEVIAFLDPVVGINNSSSFDGWYAYYPYNVSFFGDSQLTFLGTLAALAVAIALIMLLVYVISRFLRLRG